ncbi:hypothetical protein L3Y34_011099 [Caenorhabditis briggsae]|uniref:Uncharacterized protein n=1 Tax=Caenorhabditis briggsae TaxID=6238 RepID=A0AAE9CU17_CAEBR|nr:hypothetical protein L3Y34_011099 [Caenorhabditis briggsae]
MPPEDMFATTVLPKMSQGEPYNLSDKLSIITDPKIILETSDQFDEENPLCAFLLPLRFFKSEKSKQPHVLGLPELPQEFEQEDCQRLPAFKNLMKRKKESPGVNLKTGAESDEPDQTNRLSISDSEELTIPCNSRRLPIFKSITKRYRTENSSPKSTNIQNESTGPTETLQESNLSAHGVNDATENFELESQRPDSPTNVALDFNENEEELEAHDHLNAADAKGVIQRELTSIPLNLQQLPFYYMAFLTHYPYFQGVRIPAMVRFKSILSNRPPEWLYPCAIFYAHDLDLVVFKEPDHVFTDVELVRLQQHVDNIYYERCRILFPGPGEGTALIRLTDISEGCCIIYKYGGHVNRWEDYDYEEINRCMNLPIDRWRDGLLRFEYIPMPVEQLPIPQERDDEFSEFEDDSGIGESDEEVAAEEERDRN